jgi:hypothetical protein
MWHITISGHHGSRHTVAAAFWISVGIVAMIAFGDAFTLLAVALAIATTAWWIFREVEHRLESDDVRRHVTGVDFPSKPLAKALGYASRSRPAG